MRRRFFLLLLFAGYLCAEQVSITVLATTDLHGNLLPLDYVTAKPAPLGLAKLATLIRAERATNPNTLLVDCGDTIQGTPLAYAYQAIVRTGAGPLGLKPTGEFKTDPMMAAMNSLGYSSMTLGNHEFNFGLQVLERARADARFPWISANTMVAQGGKDRPFAPYVVTVAGGVKIAVIGLTTPAVPTWEKPQNLGSYRFLPPIESLKRVLAELRAHENPDLVLAAVHAGFGSGNESPAGLDENFVAALAAKVPELDAIVFGHSHREVEGELVNGILIVQPKNWGSSLARLDFTMERQANGRWRAVSKKGKLLRPTTETVPDEEIIRIAAPYQELAERYLNTPVAYAPKGLNATLGRVEDSALVDAIHRVQLHYSKADVSFTALFDTSLRVPPGKITVRQIAAMYPYENELYTIEGNGQMVKDALENAARFYLSCKGERCLQAPLVNRAVAGFNYDMAEGVEYEVDLTRPEGDRIRNLRWQGKPLAPDQKLRIAVNNYRAAGSAGYSMFAGAKLLWHSQEEIRTLIVNYYMEHKELPGEADGNWRLIPDEARRTLEAEARAEANQRRH